MELPVNRMGLRYKCEECGEEFRLKYNYNVHMQIHKERRYKKAEQLGDYVL